MSNTHNNIHKMNDGAPKDYSSVYRDEPVKTIRPRQLLDGAPGSRQFREDAVDLGAVRNKLLDYAAVNPDEPRKQAIHALNQHYYHTFGNRKKDTDCSVHVKYYDTQEIYIFRTDRNTLGAIKSKMPKRGRYRYFFKRPDDAYEEIEDDDSVVPFSQDATRQIHCRVFLCNI